jgi:hypothetical protein
MAGDSLTYYPKKSLIASDIFFIMKHLYRAFWRLVSRLSRRPSVSDAHMLLAERMTTVCSEAVPHEERFRAGWAVIRIIRNQCVAHEKATGKQIPHWQFSMYLTAVGVLVPSLRSSVICISGIHFPAEVAREFEVHFESLRK